MSDYVSKKAVKGVIGQVCYGLVLDEETEKALTDAIDEMPSADVRENKSGEWKHLGGDEWVCSECGNVIFTVGSWEKPFERDMFFCNNCGADMRKKEESK